MAEHNFVGEIGENLAREYLEEQGYKIIEQNYKTKYSEIDLVAKKGADLVFVEVRTKVGEDFGTPEDTLNNKKLAKVRYNAISYSAFKKWAGPIKIDAICIVLSAQGGPASGGKPNYKIVRLNHYENIV
jgi:putative endonuclease